MTKLKNIGVHFLEATLFFVRWCQQIKKQKPGECATLSNVKFYTNTYPFIIIGG